MSTELDYGELLGMQDMTPEECPTDLSCALKEEFLGADINPEAELEVAINNMESGKKLLKELETKKELCINLYLEKSSDLVNKFKEKMTELEFQIKHTLSSIGEYNKIIINSKK